MSRRLILHPEAEKELDIAVLWYEVRSSGLGRRFLEATTSAMKHIVQTPEGFSVIRGKVRQVPVKSFPFVLVYSATKDAIIV